MLSCDERGSLREVPKGVNPRVQRPDAELPLDPERRAADIEVIVPCWSSLAVCEMSIDLPLGTREKLVVSPKEPVVDRDPVLVGQDTEVGELAEAVQSLVAGGDGRGSVLELAENAPRTCLIVSARAGRRERDGHGGLERKPGAVDAVVRGGHHRIQTRSVSHRKDLPASTAQITSIRRQRAATLGGDFRPRLL